MNPGVSKILIGLIEAKVFIWCVFICYRRWMIQYLLKRILWRTRFCLHFFYNSLLISSYGCLILKLKTSKVKYCLSNHYFYLFIYLFIYLIILPRSFLSFNLQRMCLRKRKKFGLNFFLFLRDLKLISSTYNG